MSALAVIEPERPPQHPQCVAPSPGALVTFGVQIKAGQPAAIAVANAANIGLAPQAGYAFSV